MTIGDSSVTFQIMKIMWKKYLTIFKYLNQKVSDLYWLLGDLWPQTPCTSTQESLRLVSWKYIEGGTALKEL